MKLNEVKSLVSCMDKREKFYFTSLYQDKPGRNFYRLYKYLDKHPKATANSIKLAFANTTIGKNLAVELNQLYSHVLRALHIYRLNSKDPASKILTTIHHAQILIEKGKNQQALKLILKAKKLAYTKEEFSTLIKLITLQEELEINTLDSELTNKVERFSLEREDCLKKIQNYLELKQIRTMVLHMQYTEGLYLPSTRQPEIFQHPLLKSAEMALSKKGKDCWFVAKATIFLITGHFEESKKYSQQRNEFLKTNTHIFSDLDRIRALNNYMFLLILKNDPVPFFEADKELDQFAHSTEIGAGSYQFFKYYLNIRMEIILKNDARLEELIPLALSTISTYDKELSTTQKEVLHESAVTGCIQLHKYDQAITILNKWNMGEVEDYSFILRKIFRLVCFYELQKDQLVLSELQTFRKAIKRKDGKSKTYALLITLMKKGLHKGNINSTFKQKILNGFESCFHDPMEKKYFMIFDLLRWIQSSPRLNSI